MKRRTQSAKKEAHQTTSEKMKIAYKNIVNDEKFSPCIHTEFACGIKLCYNNYVILRRCIQTKNCLWVKQKKWRKEGVKKKNDVNVSK